MRVSLLAVVVLLGVSSPAAAQTNGFALPTQAERRMADAVSWGTVLAGVAMDTRTSLRAPDRAHALEREAIRIGVTQGATLLVKVLVHRERPCAPTHTCGKSNEHASFFSGHTALAFSTVGGFRASVSVPMASVTGGLRLAANVHWLTDVLAGAGVGLAASRIR